jgi:phosphatidylglycerophosphatase A
LPAGTVYSRSKGMTVRPTLALLFSRPQYFVALGFGTGLIPLWPGTMGSFLGFGMFWSLRGFSVVGKTILYVLLFMLGSWCCTKTGEALKQQDHRSIVFDEIFGMSVVLEFIPMSIFVWSLGFLLFRVFDVLKPWPINLVHEAKPNGFYVLLDDVVAAGYAVICVLALLAMSRWLGVDIY